MAQRTDRVTRRAQIIEVAADLFQRHGYHETTLETLAAAVGIRKASLYYHFPSKDAILVEIHEEMIGHLLDRVRTRGGTPTERLRGVMRDLVELMELFPGRLRVFFEHYRELPEAERVTSAAKRDEYHAFLVGILREGVAGGEFVIDDVELTALSILGSCNWTYQWFRPGGRLSAAEVADGFLRVLLAGISGGSEVPAARPAPRTRSAAGRAATDGPGPDPCSDATTRSR